MFEYFFSFFFPKNFNHDFFGKLIYQKGKKPYWEASKVKFKNADICVILETENGETPTHKQFLFFKEIERNYDYILKNQIEYSILNYDYMFHQKSQKISFIPNFISIPIIEKSKNIFWEIGFEIYSDDKALCSFLFSMKDETYISFVVDGY